MTKQTLKVSVIPFKREEMISKIYTACKTCYSENPPSIIYKASDITDIETQWKLIKHVLNSGHHSTLEHVTFTFFMEGVSRALSHQLVRHRIGINFSQQSQRYCGMMDFPYVIPPTVEKKEEALKEYEGILTLINNVYEVLINTYNIPAEDARMLLPNACCTNMTVTINLRELIHICSERLCMCAQWEIRHLVQEMRKSVIKEVPELKPYLAPKCELLGYCNESSTRTCHRKPLKEHVVK